MSLSNIKFLGFAVYNKEVTYEMIQDLRNIFSDYDAFTFEIASFSFQKVDKHPNLLEITCSTTVRSEEPVYAITEALSNESLDAIYLDEFVDNYSTGEKYSFGVSKIVINNSPNSKTEKFISNEIDKLASYPLKTMGFIIFNEKVTATTIKNLKKNFDNDFSKALNNLGCEDFSYKYNFSKNDLYPMLLKFEIDCTTKYINLEGWEDDFLHVLYSEDVKEIKFSCNKYRRPSNIYPYTNTQEIININSNVDEFIEKEISNFFENN